MATRAHLTLRHAFFAFGLALLPGCEALAGLTGERNLREPASTGGHSGAAGASEAGGRSGEPSTGNAGGAGANAGGAGGPSTGGAGAEAGEGGQSQAGNSGEGGVGGSVGGESGEGGVGGNGGAGASGMDGGGFAGVYGVDAPSCVGMETDETAGAGGVKCRGVSCCTSLVVPGGPFMMGRSESGADAVPIGPDSDQPEHLVTLSRFALDQFEVTVGRFRRFVEHFDGTPPSVGVGANEHIASSGWQQVWNTKLPTSRDALRANLKCAASSQTWTDAPGYNETLPLNCVDWFAAFAFCAWDEARLPTEAEWEFAATGGAANRLYPWADGPPTADKANYNCIGAGDANCSFADILVVGSKPDGDGLFGQADMAGSMWEFTRDAFDADFYATTSATGLNPVNLNTNKDQYGFIVARGGNWVANAALLRAALRNTIGRSSTYDGVGFRCARDH